MYLHKYVSCLLHHMGFSVSIGLLNVEQPIQVKPYPRGLVSDLYLLVLLAPINQIDMAISGARDAVMLNHAWPSHNQT